MESIYRHFNSSGVLLYLGISCRPLLRTSEHQKGSRWFDEIANITIEKCATRLEAEQKERQYIKAECPIYNVVHNPKPIPKATNPNTKNCIIRFRCSAEQKEHFRASAKAVGMSMSEWIIMMCDVGLKTEKLPHNVATVQPVATAQPNESAIVEPVATKENAPLPRGKQKNGSKEFVCLLKK